MKTIFTIFIFCLLALPLCAREGIIAKYSGKNPQQWGRHIPGVITGIKTDKKILALTFDLCGLKNDGLDHEILNILTATQTPATIFVSAVWLSRHREDFKYIANNPLFEIENHGAFHKPASINGKSAYKIRGAQTPRDLVFEVEYGADKIQQLTGRRPVFYRSGTAYYDEYALELIKDLGFKPISFALDGDFGARYTPGQMLEALSKAQPGDIILMHLNRPKRKPARGLKAALETLKEKGFTFVQLSGYEEQLR